MNKHPDCEDRCQILEHKGYHDCTHTGRCEQLAAMTTDTAARVPTPRTDSMEPWQCVSGTDDYDRVPADFARQLEREARTLEAQLADTKAELVEYRAAACLHANASIALTRQSEQLRERAEEFKEIGQGFERDYRNTFEQSCKNLQRAEQDAALSKAASNETAKQSLALADQVDNLHSQLAAARALAHDMAVSIIEGTATVMDAEAALAAIQSAAGEGK